MRNMNICRFLQPRFKKNMRIVVTDGPLAGYAGTIRVIRHMKKRVVVLLDMFDNGIRFELDCNLVKAEF